MVKAFSTPLKKKKKNFQNPYYVASAFLNNAGKSSKFTFLKEFERYSNNHCRTICIFLFIKLYES